MATDSTLRLRAIQPRAGQARSVPEPNLWRRHSRAAAKAARTSRRRFIRADRRATRRAA